MVPKSTIVQHQHKIFIFTDGSKEPETAFFIPHCEVAVKKRAVKKRASDHLSVYTVELLRILLAIQWVEENSQPRVIIVSSVVLPRRLVVIASLAPLASIRSGKSSCRQYVVYEIFHVLLRLHYRGLDVSFLWVPTHVGVEGNETVDILAKQSLKLQLIDILIPLSKAEVKTIIKDMCKTRKEYWDLIDTGRHLHSIQKHVGVGGIRGRSPREEKVIARLRIGHTGLNQTLHRIGKHPTRLCTHCNKPETVKHVLVDCNRYEEEKREYNINISTK
ncbi:hypothetical protein SKAU_G00415490 [Synaphobranchus kaupii]|uniref:RNase H type-1 domain-containing protein n=1 Tax=Synaphobranchus kaupii TaxID=118154 RepID=A0A9Q1IBH9_SYNKA|nr:hypothetical protein SKAU_G00415490 [Synaphobranchus kaupii]